MKIFTMEFCLFSFEKLSETAKRRAIEEHREFLLNEMSPEDFISGCAEYDTPEMLQETYKSEYEYYSENDDVIIESIEANDYMFYSSGELAHIFYKFPDREHREMYVRHGGKDILLETIPFKTFPYNPRTA